MVYATRQDLEERFDGNDEIDNLADPDDDGTTDRTPEALADASAEIDGYLAVAYDLPLPAGRYPILVSIACDLARDRLYDDAKLKAPKKAAMKARDQLAKLRDGKMFLASDAGVIVPRRAGARASEDRAFSRKAMECF